MKSSAYSNDQVRFDPLVLPLLIWLRHRVRTVEQEHRDLLIGLLPDIYRPMDTQGGFFPLDLSRHNLNAMALASIVNLAVYTEELTYLFFRLHDFRTFTRPSASIPNLKIRIAAAFTLK
jgi:hypothetical protein